MSDLSYSNFRALADRVASTPDAPVFKLPDLLKPGNWVDVSYSQFQANIHHMAKFWNSKFTSRGIAMGSVIGVWIRGFTYPDVITIFALSRAGFIPQMMPFEIPNSTLALSLLAKTNAQAIVHASDKTDAILETGTKLYHFENVNFAHVLDDDVAHIPLPVLPEASPESTVYMYHTSGSISGIPKVVPIMNKWMATIERKSGKTFRRQVLPGQSQDIWNWTGSFSHSMMSCMFQYIMSIGGCVVQSRRYDYTPTELVEMIENAGVNRIFQFAMTVKEYFEFAKCGVPEPRLLGALKGLRQITYGGMTIPREWEDWAYAQDIPLTACFGSTEAGQMLTSSFGDRRLEVLDEIKYEFSSADVTSVGGQEYAKLLEFRILPGSPDLPHPSLCDADGGWRSGDLFEEMAPGKYLFRGRDDDWLESFWAEKIDTKAIEENVYETCPDLVSKCTVVGDTRPFPALFIEGKVAGEDTDSLRSKVLERISEFQDNLYLHERITNVNMIKVVPANSLPRSRKGGVRRRAVEEQYKEEIEAMYASVNVDDVFAGVLQAAPSDKPAVGMNAPSGLPKITHGQPYIRFNPKSDATWEDGQLDKFVHSLQDHFDLLPRDQYAEVGNCRYRRYSRLVVLPWETPMKVHWSPGHVTADGQEITFYNQGGFNAEHDNERRSFPSIPKYMQEESLEKLILSNVSMCDWSIDELRHPIIVGVHFIKTAPTDAHPVSKTTPNALHQDGHKFSFVTLVNRKNAVGGENLIADQGGKYVGCQPDDVPVEDVMTRFYLDKPLDSWAAYDEHVSHYAGPVMQATPGASERSVIICDIEPMVAQVCPI